LPNGRTVTLPPGVTPEQLEAVMKRMRSGGQPSVDERALLGRIFGRGPRSRGSPNRPTRNNQSYVVFVLRDGKLVAAPIRTGLTDQDYVEVMNGLMDRDTVLVLPSASLVQSQQQFKQRFQNVTGEGLRGDSGGARADRRRGEEEPVAGARRPPDPAEQPDSGAGESRGREGAARQRHGAAQAQPGAVRDPVDHAGGARLRAARRRHG